jgi:hypothetical protein
MSRLTAVLSLLLLATPGPLAGQSADTAQWQPGARVRVPRVDDRARLATVVGRSADTLLLRWTNSEPAVVVPMSDISRLDVRTGRHRNLLKGMALGAGIGFAGGALLGAVSYSPCTGMCIMAPSDVGEAAALGGIVIGTLGLVVGTLAGLPSHDTWQRVPLDGRHSPATVGLHASAHGVGVALRF